jgi:hypothetical protein
MPGDGGGYNPEALGDEFGKKLTSYLNTPAPGMDAATLHGLNTLQNTVQTFQPGLNAGFNAMHDQINTGGLTPGMNQNIATTEHVGNQFGNIASGTGFNPEMQAMMAGNTDAMNDYRSMADSFANPQTAPGFRTIRNNLIDDVTTNNLSAFNNSGMFGSDDNRSSLAEGLGNALGSLDYGNYQQGIQNRFQALSGQTGAAGQGFGMGQQGMANRMNAMTGQGNMANAAFAQRQTGVGNQQAAAAMLPSMFNAAMLPQQTMIDIGKMREGYANKDYNRFHELLSAFTGSSNNPGMAEEAPWWQTALGVGGSILGGLW